MLEAKPKEKSRMVKRNFLVYYHRGLNTWWLPELEYIKGARNGFFTDEEEIKNYINNEENKKKLWDVPEVKAEDIAYWLNSWYTTKQDWNNSLSNWTNGFSELLFGEQIKPKALKDWDKIESKFFIERKESSFDQFFRYFSWLNIAILTHATYLNAKKNSVSSNAMVPHLFIAFVMHYLKQTDNNKKFSAIFYKIKKAIYGKHKKSIKQIDLLDSVILLVLALALTVALTINFADDVSKYLAGGIAIASAPFLSFVISIAYSWILAPIIIFTGIFDIFSRSGHLRNLPESKFRWNDPDNLAAYCMKLQKNLEDAYVDKHPIGDWCPELSKSELGISFSAGKVSESFIMNRLYHLFMQGKRELTRYKLKYEGDEAPPLNRSSSSATLTAVRSIHTPFPSPNLGPKTKSYTSLYELQDAEFILPRTDQRIKPLIEKQRSMSPLPFFLGIMTKCSPIKDNADKEGRTRLVQSPPVA